MEEVAELKTLENYELMLIFLSDLGEEGINKELDELKKHISSDGGEIFNEDTWGNREMSYRIKKQNQGFYCILNFKISPDHIAEMQRNLTISPAVIRFLLTKTPINYVFKTFEEYQALAEKEKELKETAKREEEAKKESRTGRPSADRHGPSRHESPSKTHKLKVEKKAPEKAEVKEAHEKKEAPVTEPLSGSRDKGEQSEQTYDEVAQRKPQSENLKAEIKEEIAHEKKKPRKVTSESSSKTKLEEVDAKLKSIIDNPDITL